MDRPPDPPAKTTRRQRQKAETRQLILDSAKSLFAENGFTQTTIRAVARRAGVGLGTVMSHFPDKNALLTAALLEDWSATLAQAMAALPPGQNWRERLLALSGAFYAYYAQRPSLSRVLLKEQLFNTKAWTQELKGMETMALELGAGLLAQAQAAGQIRPGVDRHLAAEALFALYQYVAFTGLALEQPQPDQMLARLTALTDLFLAGLTGDQD